MSLSILLGFRGRWLSPLLSSVHQASTYAPGPDSSPLSWAQSNKQASPFHPLACPPLGVPLSSALQCGFQGNKELGSELRSVSSSVLRDTQEKHRDTPGQCLLLDLD